MSDIQPATESKPLLEILKNMPTTKDGILSKIPLQTNAFPLTHLALAQGQSIATHTSPDMVVVTLLSGDLLFTVDTTQYQMHAGDSIYLAPDAPHSLYANADSCLQLVMMHTA